MVTAGTSSRSRGAFRPGFYNLVVPLSEERAQGMPGARCTRGLVCQGIAHWRTRAYRAAVNTPTSPAQWCYGLLRALPGGASLLSPSPPRSVLPKSFSPAYAAPEPHDLTVRSRPIRLWKRRVHRIPRPTCRDDGDTPLMRARDSVGYNSDFQKCKAKYFVCRTDSPNQPEIAQEIRFSAQPICAGFRMLCSF
jgi:hypothetical protein